MLKKIPWHWFQRFMLLLPLSALWVWAYWKISSTGRWFLWQQFTMNDLRRFNTCWKTERWQKKSIFGSVKPCHCVLLRVSLLRGDTFLRGDVVVFHMGGGLPHIKRNVSPTKNAHFDVLLYMRRASSCVLCRGKTSCGLYPSSFWVKKNRRSNTARHIVFYHYELVCTAAAKWVPLFMGPFEGWCHWEATCSPLRGLLWHSCTPAACLVYSHFTYFSGLLLLFDWCQGAPLMASHQPCIYLSTVPF